MSFVSKFFAAIIAVCRPYASAAHVNNGAGPYGEGNPSGWYH